MKKLVRKPIKESILDSFINRLVKEHLLTLKRVLKFVKLNRPRFKIRLAHRSISVVNDPSEA